MKISMLLAWTAVLCVLLTALRYPARISKKPQYNRTFHKIHIPIGLLALALALLHGLLAGNFPGSQIVWGSLLFTLNWGSLCLLLIILLAVSYLLRKQMKKTWMPLHRILTVALLLVLVLHLFDVGVHILDAAPSQAETSEAAAQVTPDAAFPGSAPAQGASAEANKEIPEAVQGEFSGAALTDGTYQGSAQGFKGTVTVEVTVEQGQVTDITVLSNVDTPNYFSRACAVLDTVKQSQSLQVDAVSGATYSSAGLLKAIADALSGAAADGELQVNESLQNLPAHGGHGHHHGGPASGEPSTASPDE